MKELGVDLENVRRDYAAGMSAADYAAVSKWIKNGCPKTPETAFTAGPARQAARLVQEALLTLTCRGCNESGRFQTLFVKGDKASPTITGGRK
jgi:hypothetical protein